MGHASTGVIIARAAAIAGLTVMGAGVLRFVAYMFEPLTILALVLPVAVIAAALFAAVALVQMLLWRKRAQATGAQPMYRQRVAWLSVTWGALTLVAAAVVAVLAFGLAVALNVPTDGTLLMVVAIVGPLPLLGVGATAVVEAVYERRAMTATAGSTDLADSTDPADLTDPTD